MLDVEELPDIKRDGIDLYSTISVNYVEAILGTTVKVIEDLTCAFFKLLFFHVLISLYITTFIRRRIHKKKSI
jgi:hypothetical protein